MIEKETVIIWIFACSAISFGVGLGIRFTHPVEVNVYPIFEKCWAQGGEIHVRGERKEIYCQKEVEEKLN